MRATLKAIKKGGVFLLGVIVLVAGLILLVIPGPGLLVIIAGLLILSTEFDWAKRYLHQARQKLKEVKDSVKAKNTERKSAQDVDRTRNHKSERKNRD